MVEIVGSDYGSQQGLKSNKRLFGLVDNDTNNRNESKNKKGKKRSFANVVKTSDANYGMILSELPAAKKAKKSSKGQQILDELKKNRKKSIRNDVEKEWPLRIDGTFKDEARAKKKQKKTNKK